MALTMDERLVLSKIFWHLQANWHLRYRSDTPTLSVQDTVKGLQRLLLARETAENPRVIVAVHPTRGLDVAGTEAVRQALQAQQEAGAAILLISEDLDEILALSDPVGVLHGGRLAGVMARAECRIEELGLLMGGAGAETAA